MRAKIRFRLASLIVLAICLSACSPIQSGSQAESPIDSSADQPLVQDVQEALPTRPAYEPGTLVEYFAQTGDTLPGLAGRFNTTVADIHAANPIIPPDVTTLPAGLPMEIPIYYRAFWGSPYQIIPDGFFVNGPAQIEFDTAAFVASGDGWFSSFNDSAAQQFLSGPEIIDLVATNFSVSPQLLLAMLEYSSGAISSPQFESSLRQYPLHYSAEFYEGVYLQLVWAANTLNNAYYGWRTGKLIEFEQPNGSLFRPDPWQNAASVALQYFYAQTLSQEAFEQAIGPSGLAASFAMLYGDPWTAESEHIPGSLFQPDLRFPFVPGEPWSFTGGPHTGWGDGEPRAALDFAPGVETRGCVDTDVWATAVAAGEIVRTDEGIAVLDLDGDGDERTGWVIFYLHLKSEGRAKLGSSLEAGQPIGHPSCEGGSSTGSHIHIARKYNGEWLPAAGALPFIMENWVPYEDEVIYFGTLSKQGQTIIACACSDANSAIRSNADPVILATPQPEETETQESSE
jgi:murein DD-endopeptidase MepM/ murein hydrolase activator NlpD